MNECKLKIFLPSASFECCANFAPVPVSCTPPGWWGNYYCTHYQKNKSPVVETGPNSLISKHDGII